MFDHLEGTLVRDEPTRLVVSVGGLGYQLHVPLGSGERLQRTAGKVRVFTLTVAQDELPKLLGFASEDERELCALLLKVAGVGPSLALALLSADQPHRLLHAIHDEDVAWLKRIKGVGPKTAQRICLEIKDKAGKWLARLGPDGRRTPSRDPALGDAVAALASLGYTPSEAETRVLAAREKSPDAGVEALVKAALRG
jgi:Holliday junction DNA helicase RuvA